jgi:RND family efflux transporter MFP subunit
LTVKILKAIIPLLFVAAAVYGALKMYEARPVVETEAVEKVIPVVRVMPVQLESIRLSIHSQGTVTARTVTELVPEIAGRILYISPSLVSGGFFKKGEILLRIDPHDYELALTRSEAEVAQAELRLDQEKAEAFVAAKEWAELGSNKNPSPLVLREPQVAQAEAALRAARAMMEQAKLDLERTEITAPFNGRVSQKNVDVGQYVSRGGALAQLYSTDVAEVRLPIPNEELAYVDIPLSHHYDEKSGIPGPEVLIQARWAGKDYRWHGRIVRTEGEIDSNTRMLYAVVQVKDPYAPGKDPKRPPLAVGMFVEAEIIGNELTRAVVLPRAAIRGSSTVYVIDPDGKLRFRPVDIFKRDREQVIVQSGLEAGELVCVSPIETVVDGMEVRVIEQETES